MQNETIKKLSMVLQREYSAKETDPKKGELKRGTLYLCATPIGNLGDITPRVLETLSHVELIAAEDTRGSMKLLNYFDIHTPMTSYHEHNKYEKAETLIRRLKDGTSIALVTDAGTPVISDPGEVLVKRCIEEGITVTSLPGPAACITALTLSGIPARRFAYEGFLPVDKKQRREILEELKTETRTIIIYEAPHHLLTTLKELADSLGERSIALCRELTKKFEEVLRMTLTEAVSYYEERNPVGEYVLVISGVDQEEKKAETRKQYMEMDIPSHVAKYEAEGMDHKTAMKQAALDRGIPKREIYRALIAEKEGTTGGSDEEA